MEINSPITETESEFISEKELLKKIPVCRRTLLTWRQNKKIPHVKMGKRVLFHWPTVRDRLLRRYQTV